MQSTGDIDRLEARIARLERRNRWTTAVCVMLGMLALAGFTQRQERVVRAEKFELVDARGTVVSEWDVRVNGPVLQLGGSMDPHLRVGLSDSGSPGSPGMQVAGEQGRLRIELGLVPEVDGTALFMFGPEPPGSSTGSRRYADARAALRPRADDEGGRPDRVHHPAVGRPRISGSSD